MFSLLHSLIRWQKPLDMCSITRASESDNEIVFTLFFFSFYLFVCLITLLITFVQNGMSNVFNDDDDGGGNSNIGGGWWSRGWARESMFIRTIACKTDYICYNKPMSRSASILQLPRCRWGTFCTFCALHRFSRRQFGTHHAKYNSTQINTTDWMRKVTLSQLLQYIFASIKSIALERQREREGQHRKKTHSTKILF